MDAVDGSSVGLERPLGMHTAPNNETHRQNRRSSSTSMPPAPNDAVFHMNLAQLDRPMHIEFGNRPLSICSPGENLTNSAFSPPYLLHPTQLSTQTPKFGPPKAFGTSQENTPLREIRPRFSTNGLRRPAIGQEVRAQTSTQDHVERSIRPRQSRMLKARHSTKDLHSAQPSVPNSRPNKAPRFEPNDDPNSATSALPSVHPNVCRYCANRGLPSPRSQFYPDCPHHTSGFESSPTPGSPGSTLAFTEAFNDNGTNRIRRQKSSLLPRSQKPALALAPHHVIGGFRISPSQNAITEDLPLPVPPRILFIQTVANALRLKESTAAAVSGLHSKKSKDDHWVLGPGDEEALVFCNLLGHGSVGVVEEVRLRNRTLPTLVRKRVRLPVRDRESVLRLIKEETQNLKALAHTHIVTIIASYEDNKQKNRQSYCLLMAPVGDNDLKTFLDIATEADALLNEWSDWIRSWFGCLASALVYMHGRGIRHQDIKPSNIIHRGSQIFFTDFSSSSRFVVGQTTSTDNPCRSSPMYAAPEIVDRFSESGNLRKHGRGSDIFALGGVFCDMLTVFTGRPVDTFHKFLREYQTPQEPASSPSSTQLLYSRKLPAIQQWFADCTFFQCILPMLSPDRMARPSAAEVLMSILAKQNRNEGWPESCPCFAETKSAILEKSALSGLR
ncbi:kinase-like protein [Trematosphaeria pertusa]|uniref:Kinase-like protein n=1 Tax=Trematosphaeria pertusa TaxID=390896 RepID=A0A6A6ITL1_9PLEO|nr:kinase-like protein [Trematosphaeria pertusa]KAF2253679.1 kinase-like protein [Trematosphaeria pertusa]